VQNGSLAACELLLVNRFGYVCSLKAIAPDQVSHLHLGDRQMRNNKQAHLKTLVRGTAGKVNILAFSVNRKRVFLTIGCTGQGI